MDKKRAVFLSSGRNANYPMVCDECGGRSKYKAQGRYECEYCRKIMLDDYGKVRAYLALDAVLHPLLLLSEDLVE